MAAQEDTVDQAIAKIQQERMGYQAQMQQPANARVMKQAEFLNHLFDEKSFSWTAAMEDLERVLPGGVQVTAIEPSRGKDGRITLHLRIAGPRERSVEMMRNMERSRRFSAPRISGENAENSQGDLQQARDSGRVNFDLLAEYNPATLEERKAAIEAMKRKRLTPEPGPVSEIGRGPINSLPAGLLQRPGYIAPNPVPAAPPYQQAGPGMRPMPVPRPNLPNPMLNRNRPPNTIPLPNQGGTQ
jgi:type IV pilus assembly protein PilN